MGAISALAALQGHLLIASGPKIILHKWTGAELNGVAFYDAPLHVVSMNIIFYCAPKSPESWKGQKLTSRAEFHAGAQVMKFWRLQMPPTASDRTPASVASEKSNRFALLFCTSDGSIGCAVAIDELTFHRLQTLQRKLVDVVPHICGLNPRSFRQFRSNGKVHRPSPDNMMGCELLSD